MSKPYPGICTTYWGSHGCDLPPGDHKIHRCVLEEYREDGDSYEYEPCSEFDETMNKVRGTDEEGNFGEWIDCIPGGLLEVRGVSREIR